MSCLRQDHTGYILACTQHGLYVYDGQRFFNLGPRQGLPEGGIVHDLTFTDAGRIILRYSDRVFVSRHGLSLSSPPDALRFRAATSHAGLLYNDVDKQMTSWDDGAIFVDQGHLDFVDPGTGSQAPVVQSVDGILALPNEPDFAVSTVFGDDATVWVGSADGRICALGRTSQRCYGQHDGLAADKWTGFLADGHGRISARSLSRLATIDPRTNTVTVETLPDQEGAYANYDRSLILTRTPSGELLTQSAGGLMIRGKSGWKALTAANGLPREPIIAVLFDREGQLWLAALGNGVLKALGYGLWENWDHHDGLSSDIVWQIAREQGGPLWVATDSGIDAVGGDGDKPVARRHFAASSYAVAVSSFDHVWRSLAPNGLTCITPGSGSVTRFQMPSGNQIVHGSGKRLWFVTQDGLYVVDDVSKDPRPPERVPGLPGPIEAAATSADGSLWVLHQGQLVHRHGDGSTVTVLRHWDAPDFDPLAIALGQPNIIWVGGAGGGLYRIEIAGDRVIRSIRIVPPDVLSNTVVSVLVDSRGWVWAGTDRGLSVLNGTRWISVNTDNGLIWNDLSQGSLFEDVDGSLWVGTSRGLSHLLDPLKLFAPEKMQPVITSISLGDKRPTGRAIPYSREPLSLGFGVLNARSNIRFRYQLEGLDKTWADTASGYARYPFLPAGHHRFVVMAYDPLAHHVSSPAFVLLRMKRPWWLWWPLQVFYGLVGLAAIYAVLRMRFAYLLRQRKILHREVELRTREMRAAQEALQLLATQDSLTKLLNRGEIQKRLVDALMAASQDRSITVGLLDIDHFKRINDCFGHIAGDEVLKEFGSRLNNVLGPGEYAGRYGGEEILIVLTEAQPLGIRRVEDLKLAACGEAFLIENQSIYVTCSIGVARGSERDTWKSLVGRADRALYRAKSEGRDRIIEAEEAISGGLMPRPGTDRIFDAPP